MEHPFFPTTTTRAEALRWLTIAEKLLSARDLMGSKSFASRARDSDPTLSHADQILSVADTLLAGDRRIGNNQHDWYAILRISPPQGRDSDLIANQYRSLSLLLNPQKNKFPFAEQAFRLVIDAWAVLSNPSRKSMYDKDIAFYLQPQQEQQPDLFSNPNPAMHQNFIFFGGGNTSGGVTQTSAPQMRAAAAVHFSQPQVHENTQSQVDPVAVGSTREPQNFMKFTSTSNFAIGSGSKPIHETVNKPFPECYPTFAGNVVASSPGATQEQVHNNTNNSNNQQQNFAGDETTNNANESENVGEGTDNNQDEDGERVEAPVNHEPTMWTACPYCYYMYEYPIVYSDCTLRCQNCKKAFQAVAVSTPPPVVDGQDGYFCCWGLLPLGFSTDTLEKNRCASSSWTPFSPMFTCPQGFNGVNNSTTKRAPPKNFGPRVYVEDDEVFVDISDTSEPDDADWKKDTERRKKKARSVKGKEVSSGSPSKITKKTQAAHKGKNVSVARDGAVPQEVVEEMPGQIPPGESSKKGGAVNARKQPGRVVKNFGKLDLNVEFSNEPEESAPKVSQENIPGRGVDDSNIEGIGFFEGLDEFLSSLPILNVVGDDKVVKAA